MPDAPVAASRISNWTAVGSSNSLNIFASIHLILLTLALVRICLHNVYL